jgi:hypothetical protein
MCVCVGVPLDEREHALAHEGDLGPEVLHQTQQLGRLGGEDLELLLGGER